MARPPKAPRISKRERNKRVNFVIIFGFVPGPKVAPEDKGEN